MGCLLDALGRGYDVLGLGRAAGGDEVLRDLVLATRGRQRRRICGSADTNVYAYSPPVKLTRGGVRQLRIASSSAMANTGRSAFDVMALAEMPRLPPSVPMDVQTLAAPPR